MNIDRLPDTLREDVRERIIAVAASSGIKTALAINAISHIVDYVAGDDTPELVGSAERLSIEQPGIYRVLMSHARRHVIIAFAQYGEWTSGEPVTLPHLAAVHFKPSEGEITNGTITVKGLTKGTTCTVGLPRGFTAADLVTTSA